MIKSIVHHSYLTALAVCTATSLVAPIAAAVPCQTLVSIPTPGDVSCNGGAHHVQGFVNRLQDGTYAYQVRMLAGAGSGIVLLQADGSRARDTSNALCVPAFDEAPVDGFFGPARRCLSTNATQARLGVT